MRKTLTIFILFTLSFSSFASDETLFEQLIDEHKSLVVDNEDEFFLELSTYSGPNYFFEKIISDVMGSVIALNNISTEQLLLSKSANQKEAIKNILNHLFKDSYPPYFCNTFGRPDLRTKECQRSTVKLLTKLVKSSHGLSIVDLTGEGYYGTWESVLIVGFNHEVEQSASLHFDILHEI